ncbi:PTPRK-like protein, partial [Mya arenaria]
GSFVGPKATHTKPNSKVSSTCFPIIDVPHHARELRFLDDSRNLSNMLLYHDPRSYQSFRCCHLSVQVSDIQDNVAASPVGYIVGVVTVIVIIGVVVVVFLMRPRLTRLFSSHTTSGNMNTSVKADLYECQDKANEINERNNRDSTDSDQLGHRHQASTSSSLKQPTSVCEIDLEFDKDAIHEAECTAGVYYNNSVALQRPKVSIDGLVEYVDSLTQDDIKVAFEGYKKGKEYIATLGPMSQQLGGDFEPFWRMVWQQKVEKIVMVTNLIENGTGKCEQYWPNVGTNKMYGEFRITCHSEDMYAEFTRRALTIIKSSEERSIYQLHFTCWPDKGIPDDVTAIIEFRQRVLNTPTTYKGPTEQYQYLHKAVVYSLTFNCTPIKAEKFQQYMKTTRRADLNRQFQNVGIYYPAENMQVLKKGSFEVSSSRETRKSHYAIRSLKIRHTRATGRLSEKTLAHMQFTEWDEIKNVPLSVENFLTFQNDVEETANKQKDGPILLHCFDGAGRTGLFCVVSMLLRKMAIEHEVSVLNAVRKVKTMRRLAIPNLDQFIFCHESVMEYLRAFDKDVYANFAGSNE